MKKVIALLVFSLGFVGVIRANPTASLFQTQIEVASTSTQEQQVALPKALEQVLIKASGSQELMELPKIQAALSSPENYLSSYSYTPGAKTTTMLVYFKPDAIQKILKDSGQKVWENRPVLLIWLTIKDNSGDSVLIGETNIQPAQTIYRDAGLRGVQVVLPIGDLQDLAVTEQTKDLAPVVQRYKADMILFGTIVENDDSSWQGNLWLPSINKRWDISSPDLYKALESTIDQTVNTLAQQSTSNDSSKTVSIKFTGVHGVSDYTALTNYLNKVAAIKDISLEKIDTDYVILNVKIIGDLENLNNSFQQDDKVTSASKNPDTSQKKNIIYQYQWIGK